MGQISAIGFTIIDWTIDDGSHSGEMVVVLQIFFLRSIEQAKNDPISLFLAIISILTAPLTPVLKTDILPVAPPPEVVGLTPVSSPPPFFWKCC